MDTTRLEAFSDGVFAIAITLLILDVRLPDDHSGTLAHQLVTTWPAYVGYVISFVTIGIMWANHHSICRLISRTTHGLVVANLSLLLLVAFVPFPTIVLSSHLRESAADQRTAAAFYSASFVAIALAYNVFWQTAAWHNRLIVSGSEATAEAFTRSYRLGVPSYLLATALAFWSPWASLGLDAGLALLYLLLPLHEDGSGGDS